MFEPSIKRIPRADESVEERRRLRDERASRYPTISIVGDAGSLSAAPGDPTLEDLWGDPVNLLYPLASAGQGAPDRERSNNARARFKQFALDQYEEDGSLGTVHNRIVAAQIRAGASPSFDPNDRLDRLLSRSIRDQIKKRVQMKNFQENLKRIAASGRSGTSAETAPNIDVDAVRASIRELEIVGTALKAAGPFGVELAARVDAAVTGITKAVTSVAGVTGDPILPSRFGLGFSDVSRDENFAPVDVPMVETTPENQKRSILDPLDEPPLMTAARGLPQGFGPTNDATMPPPNDPMPMVSTSTPMRLPEPPSPANVPIEPAGVAKDGLVFGLDPAV